MAVWFFGGAAVIAMAVVGFGLMVPFSFCILRIRKAGFMQVNGRIPLLNGRFLSVNHLCRFAGSSCAAEDHVKCTVE